MIAGDDILALFQDYANGFNDFDAEAVADCFAYPVTIWQLGKGNVFADREELLENIAALLDVLAHEEVVHSEFEILNCSISGPTAQATLSWRQVREDGDPALAFICHYMLVRNHDDLLIALVVNE
jgi:hypothetical protein